MTAPCRRRAGGALLAACAAAFAQSGQAQEAPPSPQVLAQPSPEQAPAGPLAGIADTADPNPAVPAVEILGFQLLLNRVNRAVGNERDDYRVTTSSIRHNLHSDWGTDRDPFGINQLGHPYQGAMYHGFARSAGLSYWQSLGYAFAGSAVWEIAGERTRPSRNDQVASGIGGTFLGEALVRMSNLVLEQGAGLPLAWREAAAAVIAPSSAFNRWAFGGGYGRIQPSNDALYFSRLELGASTAVKRDVGPSTKDIERNEALVGFTIDYGLPGKADYGYQRPFDHFVFQATASSANAVENVLTRGLLLGEGYALGNDVRGLCGLYGSFDYIAPQSFRVSTTAVSVGTMAVWRLGGSWSMVGTATAGVGYAGVGTARGSSGSRDYNYGVAPQALLALRVVQDNRLALDLAAREYFVSGIASGNDSGHDNIVRADAALTWRIARQHALTLRVLGNHRDARFADPGTQHQTQLTVGLFYTLLGLDRFGVVDWR